MALEKDHSICLLLAVWGENFIQDFLQLSLPSLLAPDNLPALAASYKARFVLLTRTKNIDLFEENPAFQRLKSLCEVDFIAIDDLIVFGNYSTTLTLAYDHAIKQTGAKMLNTYFVFLTSDYIMADGSLKGLTKYIDQGYSGICAGNFQVVEEDIRSILEKQVNMERHELSMKPRELLQLGLKYLHPVTLASFYDQQLIHNYSANRFFMRYRSGVVAGRFYLLHMLCIKPETMDYHIGSSCDYSFIPAMCPSGNVAIINDSDDYFVVEIQSREHELANVYWGAYRTRKLANALSEWTTAQHRKNAETTILFHTEDLSQDEIKDIQQQSDRFINQLDHDLQKIPPKLFEDHPYWQGAIGAFKKQCSLLDQHEYCDYVDLSVLDSVSRLKRLYLAVLGHPPNVRRYHYRWDEYQTLMSRISQYIRPYNIQNVIFLYGSYYIDFQRYYGWLKNKFTSSRHYFLPHLFESPDKITELSKNKVDLCCLMLRVEDLHKLNTKLAKIKEIINKNGKLILIVPNDLVHNQQLSYDLPDVFIHKLNPSIHLEFDMVNSDSTHSLLSDLGKKTVKHIKRRFPRNRMLRFLTYVLIGIPGCIFCYIQSFSPFFSKNKSSGCTNLILELTPIEKASI